MKTNLIARRWYDFVCAVQSVLKKFQKKEEAKRKKAGKSADVEES